MPDDILPKKLLYGQVKLPRPPGYPRSSFNDVSERDCPLRRINSPYKNAQTRLLWRDKTCLAHTHHELESVVTIINLAQLTGKAWLAGTGDVFHCSREVY